MLIAVRCIPAEMREQPEERAPPATGGARKRVAYGSERAAPATGGARTRVAYGVAEREAPGQNLPRAKECSSPGGDRGLCARHCLQTDARPGGRGATGGRRRRQSNSRHRREHRGSTGAVRVLSRPERRGFPPPFSPGPTPPPGGRAPPPPPPRTSVCIR